MSTKLLHLAEVAERLRRSEAAMRWMVHCNQGPKSALISGRRMWREEDVEAWLAEQFDKATK